MVNCWLTYKYLPICADSNKVDLAIAYHLSTSTKVADVETSFVTFLTEIIEKAQIDNGNVRIALIPYSRKAKATVSSSTRSNCYVNQKRDSY